MILEASTICHPKQHLHCPMAHIAPSTLPMKGGMSVATVTVTPVPLLCRSSTDWLVQLYYGSRLLSQRKFLVKNAVDLAKIMGMTSFNF